MNRRRFLALSAANLVYFKAKTSYSKNKNDSYLILGDIENLLKKNELTRSAYFSDIILEADSLISTPNTRMIMEPKRPVMLAACKEVLRRSEILGISWIITSDKKYSDRLAAEIQAICEMSSWNPSHFLDVAEMTTAVALSLDWCRFGWTDVFKSDVATSLIRLGLNEGFRQYNERSFWTKVHHNWNIVCNSGMAIGSLAIREKNFAFSNELLEKSMLSIKNGIENFHTDGAWNEGVAYWDYATKYIVYYVCALESKSIPAEIPGGLSKTGLFRTQLQGPTGRVFNFGDCPSRVKASEQLFWLASRFSRPEITAILANRREVMPLALFWQKSKIPSLLGAKFPKDYLFRDAQIATFRSDWGRDALWLAVKGGDNASNHSHLDIGTFVLEFRGQRFACDLGAGDYSIPTYFDRRYRREVDKISTKTHNTLTVDGDNQPENAKGIVTNFKSSANDSFVIIDMSNAYPNLISAKRGFRMLNSNTIVIRDELYCSSERRIRWNLITQADVKILRSAFSLTRDGIGIIFSHIERDCHIFKSLMSGIKVDLEDEIVTSIQLEKIINSFSTITFVIAHSHIDLSSIGTIFDAPLCDWR